ncbi:MAG TPA: hypothetical protein VK448_02370 [Dissulfurispiraceae bacterium]|nr:hypothetical protein [Dissulfurispiraceae bacterium]
MKNSIIIRREVYEGITDIPHYPISLIYEGHHIDIEDIYITGMESLYGQIEEMERSRKGLITLDGGYRFKLNINANVQGGFDLKFHIEQHKPSFPGDLIMTGYFHINGENVAQFTQSFKTLVHDGIEMTI